MKILYIHTYYQYRGGEDVVYEKEKALMQQQGCTVSSLEFNNIRFSGFKFLLAPFNPFSLYKTLKKINAVKPDVIHMHNWSFGASPSVIWAAKLKKVPIVHTLHNFRIICPSATLSFEQQLYLTSIKSIFPWRSIKKGVYKNSKISTFWMVFITRFNYFIGTWKKVDRFITLTGSSKAIFEKSYLKIKASQFVNKPNFVESSHTTHSSIRSDHFLFIGRLSEEKGINTLLSAFSRSTFKLRVIGDGPLKKQVEEFSNTHKQITYLGFQGKEHIIKQLEECTALIFPSICFETFGMSIIEAYSVGTPVIGSHIGSPSDLIKDGYNGLHFKSGDTEDLKRTIQFWQTMDSTKKVIFYTNALQTYEDLFTPDKNVNQLLQHYYSVINAATEN